MPSPPPLHHPGTSPSARPPGRRSRARVPGGLGALLLLALAACDSGSGSGPSPTSISASPASVSFDALGDTATVSATVLDQKGNPLSSVVPTWASGNPLVVQITEGGLLTSVAVGTSLVTARVGSLVRTIPVSVLQIPNQLEVEEGNGQEGAVGDPLPLPIVITARDRLGGEVAGARLAFTVVAGGGSVTPSPATADAEGVATASWTLGEVAGAPQNVLVSVVGAASVSTLLTATARPGPPAQLVLDDGDDQVFPQGEALPEPLSVLLQDEFDNPIPGVSVDFEVTGGGGGVDPANAETNENGRATTTWTLGASLGPQAAEARVSGLDPVPFSATAFTTPGELLVEAGGGEAATVGEPVPTPPAVKLLDGVGDPIPDVPIRFAVGAGGGSVQGSGGPAGVQATVNTNEDGIATLSAWTLGTAPGPHTLEVTVPGGPGLEFTATALTGPASVVEIVSGDDQHGDPAAVLPSPLVVRVTDTFQNPVEGVTVDFSPASGSGTADPASDLTDEDGLAETLWTLGAAEGDHSLTASIPGDAEAVFTARTGAAFQVQFQFTAEVSAPVQQVFLDAGARWSEVIVQELPDMEFTIPTGDCRNAAPIAGPFDDLYVLASVRAIDGNGGTLGRAQICFGRPGSLLPFAAWIEVDSADLPTMTAQGTLDDVILHELGHALGFGTVIWGPPADGLGLRVNPSRGLNPPPDTHFNGATAIAAFDAVGGGSYLGAKVPVQNTGTDGSRDSHWRQSVFEREIMVGTIGASGAPLSRVTAASLGDLGYVVDLGAADAYTLPPPGLVAEGGAAPAPGGGTAVLMDDVVTGPYRIVGPDGRVIRTYLPDGGGAR